jgi:hypothetical protein
MTTRTMAKTKHDEMQEKLIQQWVQSNPITNEPGKPGYTRINIVDHDDIETQLRSIVESRDNITNWTLSTYEEDSNYGYPRYRKISSSKISNLTKFDNGSISVRLMNGSSPDINSYYHFSLERTSWGGRTRRKHRKLRQSKTYKQKRSHKNKKNKKYRH